ncbi:DUF4349 domain-containing protein [Chloroflexus sp. MS-CIW-1]|uniref:DUF4349 domain-containing protein n=1 Tax=Chloroflexus sp. MS-CIW-1 TaxID=3055768 RepID=UPI0026490EE5|nr:DUF4349 domain-containing protein [Chloroflexus sp. MS-CIW-1]MDN5274020.1 DUF4349 domain-containing protein [Chloroflexus sp. MS-CIW-1]
MVSLSRRMITIGSGLIALVVVVSILLFSQTQMMPETASTFPLPTVPAAMPMASGGVSGAPAIEQRSAGYSTGGMPVEQATGDATAVDRLIIKTASLALEVPDVAAVERALRQRVEALGGFVVSVQTYGTGAEQRSTVVLRVPVERFEALLSDIEGLAHKVLKRSVSGDDVTEEYVDLESRLRNLEATNTRLLDLLARAQTVEEALKVNQALTDIQGQIEWTKGRMQYLEQSAAMSTITVELVPVPPPTPVIAEDGWQPLEVARIALRRLIELGQNLANVVIVLLVWTPVWLPVVLLGFWAWRRVGRRSTAA